MRAESVHLWSKRQPLYPIPHHPRIKPCNNNSLFFRKQAAELLNKQGFREVCALACFVFVSHPRCFWNIILWNIWKPQKPTTCFPATQLSRSLSWFFSARVNLIHLIGFSWFHTWVQHTWRFWAPSWNTCNFHQKNWMKHLAGFKEVDPSWSSRFLFWNLLFVASSTTRRNSPLAMQ